MTTKITSFVILILLKIGIAVTLFVSMQVMPYSFYQLSRLILTVLFVMIGADELKRKNALLCAFSWACAILFQPVRPIIMFRRNWVLIDLYLGIIVTIWILIDAFIYYKSRGDSADKLI